MVKVNAPAMSLDASGSLGNALVFSKWKGRNYVRTLVTPSNPKSALQVAMRANFKMTSQAWAAVSTSDRATWDDLADQGVYSPFNAYMSKNQERWRNFLAPSEAYPAAETGTQSAWGTPVATAGVRQISINFGTATLNDGWGMIVFRNTSTSPSNVLSEVIAVLDGSGAASGLTYVDTPLEPGTYFYDFIPFTTAGLKGSALGAVSATVA